jgi:hypothetical protein
MTKIVAPKFKHDVTFCGEAVDGGTCKRLPRHNGDHELFVRGNGVAAPKRRKTAKTARKVAPKTTVRDGITYKLVAVVSRRLPRSSRPPRRSRRRNG